MRSESYLVRMRGCVAGPYSMADLQKMVRRGTLSRVHEVCVDGINWTSASSIEGLFASSTTAAPAIQEQSASHIDMPSVSEDREEYDTIPRASGESDGGPVPHRSRSTRYFYRRAGIMAGPVSVSVLRDLASSGMLGADDWVLEEGAEAWILAQAAEPLSSVYASARQETRSVSACDISSASPERRLQEADAAGAVRRQTSSLNLAGGLSAAALLLFCLNIPYDRNESGLVWWWHLLPQSGMGTLILACAYILLASVGLLFVAPLLKGRGRAWPYLGVGVLGFLLLMIAAVLGARIPFGLVLTMLVPLLGAAVVCTSCFRRLASESKNGRTTQVTAFGLMSLAAVAAAVGGGFAMTRLQAENAAVTQGVIIALILSSMGQLSGLAGGTLGLATFRAGFSRPLNMATIIIALVAMAIPGIAVSVVGYAVACASLASSPEARFIFVQTLRVLVAGYVFICLSAMGLFELLVCADPRWCEARRES